ncbi:hypothetical protein [Kutzneria kofuensis]|uniref:hypothetical protein n=1 Tax=Kutzneria kofuensis TaxID=103725 RepID=UPI0031E5AB0F
MSSPLRPPRSAWPRCSRRPRFATPSPGWQADLVTDAVQTNMSTRDGVVTVLDPAWRQGYAVDLLAVHELATPTDRVDARLSARIPAGAQVDVDVRGRLADRSWTEWTAAGTTLPGGRDRRAGPNHLAHQRVGGPDRHRLTPVRRRVGDSSAGHRDSADLPRVRHP